MKASNLRMIYNSIIGNLNTSMSRTLQFLVFVILLSIFALTHAPISAHSRSLPHVLMHEYLWKNDKSPSLLHYARWLASQQVRERERERERKRERGQREREVRERSAAYLRQRCGQCTRPSGSCLTVIACLTRWQHDLIAKLWDFVLDLLSLHRSRSRGLNSCLCRPRKSKHNSYQYNDDRDISL